MLPDQTRRYIETLDNAALVEYVTRGTEYYESEAIDFAKQQLSGRNLSFETTEELCKQVSERIESIDERESRRLGVLGKALCFFGGMTLMPGVLVVGIYTLRLRVRGEYGKISDAGKWAGMGFLFGVVMLFFRVAGRR